MLKKSLLPTLIALCCYCLAFSQNTDSVNLVTAKWNKQRVAPRVKLMTHQFSSTSLFSSNQNISYLEVKNTRRSPVFAIGAEVKERKTTSTFGKENHAFAAINGTFFDMKNGGSVDFIKVNGKVISNTRQEKTGRARHQRAALVIQNGKLQLKIWDKTPDWELTLPEDNVMLTGPVLTLDHVDEELDTTAFTRSRHPRTAIGFKPDGKIILLTVDGRRANTAGMSLTELTKTMRWLGCTSAINLDGGGSTTLWVNGSPDGGVINYPTDNKLFDHYGERKVSTVILLKKKP